MSEALMKNYAPAAVSFSHGKGASLWDTRDKHYLDALSGIAVCSLGHAHPAVTTAISDQAARLVHTSNLYQIDRQVELAERLTQLAGMDRVLFVNSGAEANEAGIKLARKLGRERGMEVPHIVVAEGAFHGRTAGALSATASKAAREPFGELVDGFIRVPFGDVQAIRAATQGNQQVIAILVEPILGEGGVVIPPDGYLEDLRKLCDDNNWLLMLDEVQTGVGRTGRWFAHQHGSAVPDVMLLAKALGNGVPIGACLARGAAADVLGPGTHGSTFGGNPLASSAALAVLETIDKDGLLARATELGERFKARLSAGLAGNNHVVEVRARGLMIGVQLDADCGAIVAGAMERGVLLNVTAGNVVRLLPPMVMSDAEADQVADTVIDLVRDWSAGA